MTTASAPASSANLGPGFDVLALALDMRCTVRVTPTSEWSVVSGGEPAPEATIEMVRSLAGDRDPLAVQIFSGIPVARGLGSSAAILVAAAAAMAPDEDRKEWLESAVQIERHADNVAAATYGGLVAVGADGSVNRLSVHPSLNVVVAVPNEELLTAAARAALSPEVPRGVAVRTAARLSMLVEGLRTGSAAELAAALGDEMHEAPRRSITETPAELIDAALGAGAVYAAWSGAGPSVVAFVTEDAIDAVVESFEQVPGVAVHELAIDREGVRIE